VGEMHAGSGRNIIPSHATLSVETRGETSEINDFVRGQVESIVEGAAKMYENDYEMKVVGEARGSKGSLELAKVVERSAKEHPFFEHVQLEANGSAGSEDATFFMEDVQKNGGLATYCIFGTELAAGHHNERFDINEETLLPAVEVLFDTILRLGEK
jgi:aminobenzoyl-glutamate utilization protein A